MWLAAAAAVFLVNKKRAGQIGGVKTPETFAGAQGNGRRKRTFLFFVSSLLAAVCSACVLRMILHVDHVSKWLAAAYVLLAVEGNVVLYGWFFDADRKELMISAAKTAVGCMLLAFYYYKLSIRTIGAAPIAGKLPAMSVGIASSMILFGTAVWLHGRAALGRFEKLRELLRAGFFVLTPFLAFLMVELSWNPDVSGIDVFDAGLNILIYALLTLFFYNLIRRRMFGLSLFYAAAWVIGAANHFVYEFRGQPILATDLFSLGTALTVAGQYHYGLTEGLAFSFLLLYCAMAAMSALQETAAVPQENAGGKRRKYAVKSGMAAVSAMVLAVWISSTDFASKYSIPVDFWWQAETYKDVGFAPAFITFFQKMKVEKPEDYSLQKANEILEAYRAEEDEISQAHKADGTASTDTQGDGAAQAVLAGAESETGAGNLNTDAQLPTIVAIMNESFSDISALGPLSCAETYLDFLYSLKDDPRTLEFGYNYVSTRGGGTSTTEFEFLTGNSISNTNGINPYSAFSFKGVPSMVGRLNNLGYKTIAMHPEAPGNWRRSSVYPALGFDEFLSIGSFEGAERTVWDRVSDLGDYKKLIEVFESQDSPAFIFNVTMQNHGGYDENGLMHLEEDERVSIDEEYSGYKDVQMYESLINKADNALEYLIDYFGQTEKPVIVCFFGDHQPSLNGEFENSLLEAGRTESDTELSLQEKYYRVPYFIWSNYEIDADFSVKDTQGNAMISTNYLGALLQRYAGIPLSAYSRYLLAQRADIPVLNWVGYYAADETWNGLTDDAPNQKWLDTYRLLQYNALFDKKRSMELYVE